MTITSVPGTAAPSGTPAWASMIAARTGVPVRASCGAMSAVRPPAEDARRNEPAGILSRTTRAKRGSPARRNLGGAAVGFAPHASYRAWAGRARERLSGSCHELPDERSPASSQTPWHRRPWCSAFQGLEHLREERLQANDLVIVVGQPRRPSCDGVDAVGLRAGAVALRELWPCAAARRRIALTGKRRACCGG